MGQPDTRKLQYFPDKYQECAQNYATDYLNRADVKEAIHADPHIRWDSCNMEINVAYSRKSVNDNMIPYIEYLASKNIRVVIFSGDDDTVCSTQSLQDWIWKYGISSRWQAWYYDAGEDGRQIGGYHVSFSSGKHVGGSGFEVYTVHGAGHMVPSTRSRSALALLERVIGTH